MVTVTHILFSFIKIFHFFYHFNRCEQALLNKVPIDPAVDRGKWYDVKLARLQPDPNLSNGPAVPHPPIMGWKEFPQSEIPSHFNSGHIYHHLIESIAGSHTSMVGQDDVTGDEDCQTVKPLKRG